MGHIPDSGVTPKPLTISVILPTHNRANILQDHLRHLAAQTCPRDRFEVIVVDGGSDDETPTLMRSMKESAPYRLISLRQGNMGPGSNRNLGIRHSRGDLLLFINDDVLPEPELVQEHLRFHELHPESNVAMLGQVRQAPELNTTPFMRFFVPFAYEAIEGREQVDFRFFWTCNISVKKSFLLDHGLFNESIAYPAHEDIELGYRLEKRGLKILYNPNAVGYHHHFQTFEGECRHQRVFGRYFHLLWRNVPDWRLYERVPLIYWRTPPHLQFRRVTRHLGRLILFNDLTVPFIFMPLLSRLEHTVEGQRWARHLYWKVLTYHARKGIAEGLRAQSVLCIFNLFTLDLSLFRKNSREA